MQRVFELPLLVELRGAVAGQPTSGHQLVESPSQPSPFGSNTGTNRGFTGPWTGEFRPIDQSPSHAFHRFMPRCGMIAIRTSPFETVSSCTRGYSADRRGAFRARQTAYQPRSQSRTCRGRHRISHRAIGPEASSFSSVWDPFLRFEFFIAPGNSSSEVGRLSIEGAGPNRARQQAVCRR